MNETAVARIPDPGEPRQQHVPLSTAERGWLDHVAGWLTNPDNTMTTVAVALGLLLAVKMLRRRKTTKAADDLTTTDRAITRITAGIATAVVALGMWEFFTDVITVHWSLRLALFAFIELGIFDASRRATRHLYRHGDLGNAHRAVFVLAAISATLSAIHADSLDLRLFRVAAAGVASYMWFESLREQRDILHHRNPGKYPPVTKKGIPWRWIGVTLGLVEPTTLSVSDVATHRRIDRLSRLLDQYHAVTADTDPGRIQRWRIARLKRRVVRKTQAACKYINLAEDPAVRQMLLRRLSVVRGIVAATNPNTVTIDGWADVAEIRTGDADRDRHIIDVDPTVTDAPASDASAVTVTASPTIDADAVTPAEPVAVIPTVTTDAVTDGQTTTVTDTPQQPVTDAVTDTPTVTRKTTVTVKRPTTDVVAVRPLARDLIDPRLRDWSVKQVRDYAADKARQVVAGGGSKKDGMRVFLLLCMAMGVDPAGAWMAEAVGGAQSAARTNKPGWLAELAVADAEQILLAEHNRIVAELADGGDVRG